MLRRVGFHDYRGFEKLDVAGLKRVNLFTGQNNVGKTALLEGIFQLLVPRNPASPLAFGVARGFPVVHQEQLAWLFRDRDMRRGLALEAEDDVGPLRLELRLPPSDEEVERPVPEPAAFPGAFSSAPENFPIEVTFAQHGSEPMKGYLLVTSEGTRQTAPAGAPFLPATYVPAIARVADSLNAEYSNLIRAGKDGYVLETLRRLDPRLQKLVLLSIGAKTLVHADFGKAPPIPLPLLGDGAARMFHVATALTAMSNGTLLVDEIDSGIHHGALAGVLEAVFTGARDWNTQVFATTHSLECVHAAFHAAKNIAPDDLGVFRLERRGDRIEAVAIDASALETAVGMGLEVR